MSKIFRRIMCMLLGIILGLVTTLSAVAATVYYTYGNLTLGNMTNNKFVGSLGQLNGFSIEDLIGLMQKGGSSPENYTFADLEADYGFDIVAFINQLSGSGEPVISTDESNAAYISDLKKTSIFSLFSSEGFSSFVDDLSFGAVLSFIPSDRLFAEQERLKLRKYTLGQMFEKDEDGQSGLVKALRDVRVGGLLPRIFAYDEVTGEYSVKDGFYTGLNVVANVELDSFIDIVNKKSDWGTEICEGGLSAIGKLPVGEILELCKVPSSVADSFVNAVGSLEIRDLFEKNDAGKYVFKADGLYDAIRVGGIFGYDYDETDGKWYKDGEIVSDTMQTISSLNLKDLVHAFTEKDDALSTLRKISLVFGDISVGGMMETLGYKLGEDGVWTNSNGKEFPAPFFGWISDLKIEDATGGYGPMTWGRIRLKLVTRVKDLLNANGKSSATLGEGFGSLLGITCTKTGDTVEFKDKNGNAVNTALAKMLSTPIMDFVEVFGEETFDRAQFTAFVLTFVGDVKIGYFANANDESGEWLDANGEKIAETLVTLYDIEIRDILTPIFNGEKDVWKILVSVVGEDATLGDVILPFIPGCSVYEDGSVQYPDVLDTFSGVLDKVFDIKVGDIDSLDGITDAVKGAVKDVYVGDLMKAEKRDGVWYNQDGTTVVSSSNGKIMVQLYDKTIGQIYASRNDLLSLFDDMKVGDAMGYKYCNGSTGCDVGSHVHKVGWYTSDGQAADAVTARIADLKISDFMGDGGFDIYSALDGLKLGEAMKKIYCDGGDECQISHEHEKGWFTKSDSGYERESAMMQKLYDADMAKVLKGEDDLLAIMEDVSLGDAMNKLYCDGTADGCAVIGKDFTHVHEEGWYEKSDGSYKRVGDVLTEKICGLKIGAFTSGSFDLATTFGGVKLGEVLKYEYDETDGVWRDKDGNKVGVLESTVADIDMGEMLGDEPFDIKSKFDDVYFGELMGYTRVDNGGSITWEKNGEEVEDEIILCVVDFKFSEVQGDGFSSSLMDNLKTKVTVVSIFGEGPWTAGNHSPISIIDKETTIGEINTAISAKMTSGTAGELYDAGLLPLDGQQDKMASVYGALAVQKAKKAYDDNVDGRKDTKEYAAMRSALHGDSTDATKDDAVDDYIGAFSVTINASTYKLEVTHPTDTQAVEKVGKCYWRSLTTSELVDVLLNNVNV